MPCHYAQSRLNMSVNERVEKGKREIKTRKKNYI